MQWQVNDRLCSILTAADRSCFDICQSNVAGRVGENELELVVDTDEPACLERCEQHQQCGYYTHYNALDPDWPGLCVLQTELVGPLQPCLHCSTGIPACSNTTSACRLSLPGHSALYTALLLNVTGTTTVSVASLGGQCELAALVVAGGGFAPGKFCFDVRT